METLKEKINQQIDITTLNLYLNYLNNFITIEGFSNHYNISNNTANIIIKNGRKLNEQLAQKREK